MCMCQWHMSRFIPSFGRGLLFAFRGALARGRTEAGNTDWGVGYGDKAARAARAGVRDRLTVCGVPTGGSGARCDSWIGVQASIAGGASGRGVAAVGDQGLRQAHEAKGTGGHSLAVLGPVSKHFGACWGVCGELDAGAGPPARACFVQADSGHVCECARSSALGEVACSGLGFCARAWPTKWSPLGHGLEFDARRGREGRAQLFGHEAGGWAYCANLASP